MTIQFVMPDLSDAPIGGYLTVYSLCGEFVKRGHQARVILPRRFEPPSARRQILIDAFTRALTPKRPPVTWFPVDPRVELCVVPDLSPQHIPAADATVATLWVTAPIVAGLGPAAGIKLYYVQAHEVWAGPKEAVYDTYRLPLHKIAVATWLRAILDAQAGEGSTDTIPYGLDHENLFVEKPFSERAKRVAMLYSADPIKGAWDGVTALEIVKTRQPDLEAVLFGGAPRHPYLPEWIEYVQRPSRGQLRYLYNSCQLFLHTSWDEGFGLPPAEAMACGCPCVATRSGGPADYVNAATGFWAEPRNPQALADVLGWALASDLAPMSARAVQEVARFRWDVSADAWLAMLQRLRGTA